MKNIPQILCFFIFAGLMVACTNGSLVSSSSSQSYGYGSGLDGDQIISSALSNTATYNDTVNRTRSYGASFRITTIDGTRTVFTAPVAISGVDFLVGDEVLWIISGAGTTSSCYTSVGQYGFNHVVSVSGSNLAIDYQLPGGFTPNNLAANTTTYCLMELVRVPNFSNLTLTGAGSFTTQSFNYVTGNGGIFALRASGTVLLNGASTINASGTGFTFGAAAGTQGDGINQTGISTTASNANGGGGSAGSGASGGANYAVGGPGTGSVGGVANTFCAGPCSPDQRAFFGGGGGAGIASPGGGGGGMLFIYAKSFAGSGSVLSNGNPASNTSGGGGGGGSILITSISTSGFNGLISSSGGNCPGASGGGGGGGVARVVTCNSGYSGTFQSGGGTGNVAGGPGFGTAVTSSQACSN